MVRRFFRTPAFSAQATDALINQVRVNLGLNLTGIASEFCFYVVLDGPLTTEEERRLVWLLAETFEPNLFGKESFFMGGVVIEVGPQLNFETPFSSCAVEICRQCGLQQVTRLECSRRFCLKTDNDAHLNQGSITAIAAMLHDPMTEQVYPKPLTSFDHGLAPQPVRVVPLMKGGIDALRLENATQGMGMDEQDLALTVKIFQKLRRDPTDVELLQDAEANSEHCRHPFFRGELIIDGHTMPESLMEIIKTPWRLCPGNSLIAFHDDSSAIKVPWETEVLASSCPGEPAAMEVIRRSLHPTQTAETHNFPTGKAPYPGAATGTGGRIRDNLSVGRGGLMGVAGTAYSTGNLRIPGFEQPWEKESWTNPNNWATPLQILIEASNGASDYGNCIGEPVIYGFTRTAGLMVNGEWRSWTKPILYTVGVGELDGLHVQKGTPQKGMFVVQIGGPAYRIGIGGGSASSMIQGENVVKLDTNAVQRGNPEMEQRVWRVIQTSSELGNKNPIISIHDLGAGGDCNALPELVSPAGARIDLRKLPVGDTSLSTSEIWRNESQEREAILTNAEGLMTLEAICKREGVPMAIVGQVTGDGLLVLHDENDGSNPVALPLDLILENLPQKCFALTRIPTHLEPLQLPEGLTVQDALSQVLRLPGVASKRHLTTKVDRCVTGLVAQQQCVGPMHTTLADFGVMAQSHFGTTGVALSLGEQPLKGLISPAAMARLAVSEALLNMAGAKITDRKDIRCSANWMWAAKLPGEGAHLWDAAIALRDILCELGIAIDGGKDSLTMAAKQIAPDGSEHVVKAPGELVIAAYAPMPDITCKITPAVPADSLLLYIDLGEGKNRLGGSALAQVFGQVGNESPDVNSALLEWTFDTVQWLVELGRLLAIHDRSDGGLIVTLLEMAFAGCTGLDINISGDADPLALLFNEEPGLVVACKPDMQESVDALFWNAGITTQVIGRATAGLDVRICCNGEPVLVSDMLTLRGEWERTSTEIEKIQADPAHAEAEHRVLATQVTRPAYELSFEPKPNLPARYAKCRAPSVAILRVQGTNSDREMAAAFLKAGFSPHDVTMNDLLEGRISLQGFSGVSFPGGFAFADVLDAGKGWAGVIRYNPRIQDEFDRFFGREDTFSLGVCNGCQLMALLGLVPGPSYGLSDVEQPRFIHNASAGSSRKFESRFSTVEILPSPAIMLKGMEGSRLGVWVAHGEGRLHVPDPQTLERLLSDGLAPVRFAYPEGGIAEGVESYPFNPNGSPAGIAALCSPNGRHLAIMPHPERTTELWNWPWLPESMKGLAVSPWLQLFQNARHWCERA